MTALERMAKAALEAHQRAFRAKFPLPEGATPDGTWETLAPEYRARHLDTMRAALEALRDHRDPRLDELLTIDMDAVVEALLNEAP